MASAKDLTTEEYRHLAEFRRQIRQFLSFSEGAARQSGIEPRQHQVLLVLKGLPENVSPTVGELASRLFIKHHTTVGLVDRLVEGGFVVRIQDRHDRRQIHVRMTATGKALLRRLSLVHRLELERSGPALANELQSVIRNLR